MKNIRKGFTLIELIFVILVLAIVVTINTEIIFQSYKAYLYERAVHRGSIKTEIVSNKIVNRLSESVSNTIIAKKTDGSFVSIEDVNGDSSYTILEWIGSEYDSFIGVAPGWDGFADLDQSSLNQVITPGSSLGTSDTMIATLSYSEKDISDAALFFAGEYTPYTIGFNTNISGISKISNGNGEQITLSAKASRKMSEFYKISWTAYAVVPENCGTSGCDLLLKYNYQPWNGDNYDDGKSQLLAENVTSFKFLGSGNTLRFKICILEQAGPITKTVCKEKAVIR